MTPQVRRRVVVHGRVHGVGFRASCARQASRLGLAGWVRNCADHTVEAVFEGPRSEVDQMTSWVETGPMLGHVTFVERFDEPPVGESGFVIR